MGDMGLRLVAPKSRQSQISAEQQSIGSLSLSLFLSLFLSLSLDSRSSSPRTESRFNFENRRTSFFSFRVFFCFFPRLDVSSQHN